MVHVEVWSSNIYQHTKEDEVEKEDKNQIMNTLDVMLRRLNFILKAVENHWPI